MEMRAESHISRWMTKHLVEATAGYMLVLVAVLVLADIYSVSSTTGNIMFGVVMAPLAGMAVVFFIGVARDRPGATRLKYENLTADEQRHVRRSCYLFLAALALALTFAALWTCIG